MLKNLVLIDIIPESANKNTDQINIREITIISSYKVVITDNASFNSAYEYLIDSDENLIVNLAFTGFVRMNQEF